MKNVAVKGCTILVYANIPPQAVPSEIGAVPVVSPSGQFVPIAGTGESLKMSINNLSVYENGLQVTVPSGSALSSGATLPNPVVLTFQGSSTKNTDDEKKIVLEGDLSGAMSASFVQGETTISASIFAKVTVAGQTVVTMD